MRTAEKGEAAVASVKALHPNAQLHILLLDLLSLSSVKNAAKEFLDQEKHLHGLINNAGIMAVSFAIGDDGYETQWQTNYLSHWLLTHLLLPTMQRTSQESSEPGQVRIVNVSSDAHEKVAPSVGIDFDDMNQEKGYTW